MLVSPGNRVNQANEKKQLIEALSSSDPNQRAHAAISLGKQGALDTWPQLKQLTQDPDRLVALSAMYSCWQLRDDPIDARLLIDAASSHDESQVALAVEVISIAGEPMVEDLKSLVTNPVENALVVLDLLDEIGNESARHAIEELQDTQTEIGRYARQLLEEWDD